MAKKKAAKKSSKKGIAIAAAALVAVGAFMPSEEEEVPETPVENEIVIQQEPSEPADEEIIIDSEPVVELPKQEESTEIIKPDPAPSPAPVVVGPETAFREKLSQYAYVASAESDKFHYPSCKWTNKINDENLVAFDSKDEAKAAGYASCGTCNP